MKKRIYAFALLIALLLPLLTGCTGGITGDEAKAHIGSFFAAVEAGDFQKAASYLHPERPADLAPYFSRIESDIGRTFSTGVTISRYTGFSVALYDSTVDGSTYMLQMELDVGGHMLDAEIELVRNDAGFGIYNLDITR